MHDFNASAKQSVRISAYRKNSQFWAGGQKPLSGDIDLQVAHVAPRKHHFYHDVGAILKYK